jgi:hypothetical protein
MNDSVTTLDTIPLLHLLANVQNQKLSRGETMRQDSRITNEMINEAQRLGYVFIGAGGDFRDGQQSSLASVLLTNLGEDTLDFAEQD